jgi:hypothetical protein
VIRSTPQMPAQVDLLNPGNRALSVLGASGDMLGNSASWLGDVNNDAVDDFALGGAMAYTIYGEELLGNIDLASASLPGSGIRMRPPTGTGYTTGVVAGVGDVSYDGIPDVAIGFPDASDGATSNGVVYAVFNRPNRTTPEVALQGLGAHEGARMTGASSNDRAGAAIAPVHDDNEGHSGMTTSSPGSTRSAQQGSGGTTKTITPAFQAADLANQPKLTRSGCWRSRTASYAYPDSNGRERLPKCRRTASTRAERYDTTPFDFRLDPPRSKHRGNLRAQSNKFVFRNEVRHARHQIVDSFGRPFAAIQQQTAGKPNRWRVYRVDNGVETSVARSIDKGRWSLQLEGKSCMASWRRTTSR